MGRCLLVCSLLLAGCGDEESVVQKGKSAPVVAETKAFRAELEIRQLEADIAQYEAFHGEWPADWRAMKRSAVDPWGRTYLFIIEEEEPLVWSLGPDGEDDTDDDIYAG